MFGICFCVFVLNCCTWDCDSFLSLCCLMFVVCFDVDFDVCYCVVTFIIAQTRNKGIPLDRTGV